MNRFLIDGKKEYEYRDLLADIGMRDYYFPYYRTDSLYLFFVNLITALINDKPIALIDADLSENETGDVVDCGINRPMDLQPVRVESLDELLHQIIHSRSEVTLFTSGTTGQPKKVVHDVATLTRFVKTGERYSNQRWAFAYNPSHMAGLQVFFQAVLNRNLMVNVFNVTRADIYKAVDYWQVTHISGTPTFYRLLLPVERAFDSVQRVTFGGEKSEQKLYDAMAALFPKARLNNIYASTEAGSLFVAKGAAFQIPESVRGKIKVVDDELLIHRSLLGKSVDFQFVGEYYCTGDLIEWVNQAAGIFSFKGRKNELINVGGYKINPSEVENALLQMPGIVQAFVFGKSNSVLGNVLCAEIKLSEGVFFSEKEIRQSLSGKLQDFKIPRIIRQVNEFDLTRTGKMKRI